MADTPSPEIEVRDRLAEALFMRAFPDGIEVGSRRRSLRLRWNDLDETGRRWWQNDAALFMASTLPAVNLKIVSEEG